MFRAGLGWGIHIIGETFFSPRSLKYGTHAGKFQELCLVNLGDGHWFVMQVSSSKNILVRKKN